MEIAHSYSYHCASTVPHPLVNGNNAWNIKNWEIMLHISETTTTFSQKGALLTSVLDCPCLNSRPIILSLQAASLEVVLTFILFCSFVVRTSRSLCHLYRAGQHATDQYKYRNIHASALHPKPQRNFCWGVKFSLEVYQTAKTKNLNKTWEE